MINDNVGIGRRLDAMFAAMAKEDLDDRESRPFAIGHAVGEAMTVVVSTIDADRVVVGARSVARRIAYGFRVGRNS